MGTTCEILNMFNGDRSNSMYIELKKGMFLMGARCECGANIKENLCDKKSCEATKALANHLIYPTYSILDNCKKNYGCNHWALIVEVCKITKSSNGQTDLIHGFTSLNEFVLVCFNDIKPDKATKFSNINIGNSIVILYAEQEARHKENKLVVVNNPDHCYIFNAPFLDIQGEAEKLLNSSDMINEKKELDCFGCGVKTKDLMRCSGCRLAQYCSKECQTKSWKLRHKNLCKQSEILLRLASLTRNQVQDKCYSFNIDEKTEVCPLPPYIYKHEFVQKQFAIK
jgi:hypothetical protein